jgi:hypothetical protein
MKATINFGSRIAASWEFLRSGKSIFPLVLSICSLVIGGCASRKPFWSYVVEDDVSKPLPKREAGTKDDPKPISPHNVHVAYNDGSTLTEVWIPVLTSGQQIVIDHKAKGSPASLSLVPIPPSVADKTVEEAYVQSGQPIVQKEKPVSIVKGHEKIKSLVKEGNYELALEYCAQILARYPNHVKTLRTKGSLLLKMGETDAAIKAYSHAQEIEPDPRVEEQIKKLEATKK